MNGARGIATSAALPSAAAFAFAFASVIGQVQGVEHRKLAETGFEVTDSEQYD